VFSSYREEFVTDAGTSKFKSSTSRITGGIHKLPLAMSLAQGEASALALSGRRTILPTTCE
jgi:hypothetical protein